MFLDLGDLAQTKASAPDVGIRIIMVATKPWALGLSKDEGDKEEALLAKIAEGSFQAEDDIVPVWHPSDLPLFRRLLHHVAGKRFCILASLLHYSPRLDGVVKFHWWRRNHESLIVIPLFLHGQAVADFETRYRNAHPHSRVLLFYEGHGSLV